MTAAAPAGAATSDVLVVGAGVIGAATAFHLSRLGAGSVTVLDRATVASGMSSRSSALVRMHYTFPGEVDLAVRSDAMFDAWTELTGRPACVRRTGFVRIVTSEEGALLRANVAMQRKHGANAEVIDAAELARLAPGLRTDDVECAAWEPHGGYGDGAIVAGDLLAAARDSGVGYRPSTPARALITDGDRVTGVRTDAGPLYAGTVVLACGVWSPALLATAGIDLPIETELHKVAVVRHPDGGGAGVACIDSTTKTYFRPEAAGQLTLVGSFDGPRGADPDGVPATARADELAELVGAAARRVPALADGGITRGITGVYDMTPDARPMLGELPGRPGLIVAAGFSGMGFKISPAVGEALAELITSGAASHVELLPFRPSRFAEGAPISPVLAYSDD
ncbi:MAG TPA: FAD-binding oxidoreductase [Streptosporangiaceae bacterium]|nr:FAD-binding oxidoreductase [Streptosporangiaceae bacterium]